MMTGDLEKWANTKAEDIEKIATTIWAKRFTYKQLRSFQANYSAHIEKLSRVADLGVLDEMTAYQNMLETATRAIDFQQFGD
jgi:hypothetical protein